MKKLILSFLVLSSLSFAVNAQNLEMSWHYGAIANGSTIDVSGEVNSMLDVYVYVKNIGSSAVDVKVRKEEISVVPGSSNMFCFASQCYGDYTLVSQDSVNILPGGVDSTFSGEYFPFGNEGVTVIRYTFFNMDDNSDTASVTIRYTGTLSTHDITVNGMSAPYPNPASERVYFNYYPETNNVNRKVIIHDLTGRVIREAIIPEGQGVMEIELTGVDSGIHFYSYITNQGIVFTKKLVVKR